MATCLISLRSNDAAAVLMYARNSATCWAGKSSSTSEPYQEHPPHPAKKNHTTLTMASSPLRPRNSIATDTSVSSHTAGEALALGFLADPRPSQL